jgi:hypothetical protein
MNWAPCGSRLNLLGISEQNGGLEVQFAGPLSGGNTLALTNPIPSYGPNSQLKTAVALGQDFLVPNHGTDTNE